MVLHGLGNRGNNGETDAVVFYDLATGWLEAVPVRTNSDTLRAFQQMFGRLEDVNAFSTDVERRYAPPEVREIYCDKAREFISVCKRLGTSVAHSTPGMPRTNAIVESKVKLVLHGARVALRQAGLSAKFWPYACRHFCHARNIELREGQSAHSARFDGAEFGGMILPFGCLVDFFPTPARKKTRRSQKDDVVIGDGAEYALPASEDGLVDVEAGFDEDGFLEWIDDGDEAKEGVDITLKGTGQFSSVTIKPPTQMPPVQPLTRLPPVQLPTQPPPVPPPIQPPLPQPTYDDGTGAKEEVKAEGTADDVVMDAKPHTEIPGRPTPELTRSGEVQVTCPSRVRLSLE